VTTLNPKYAQVAAKAAAALTTWGEPVTLVQPGTSTFDPATGLTTAGSDITTSCRAVIMPVNVHRVDNTNVLSSDMTAKVAAAGLSVTPAVGDTIKRGLVEYVILAVRIIGPDGVSIVYDLDLRLS
jgi:hypothetical protein